MLNKKQNLIIWSAIILVGFFVNLIYFIDTNNAFAQSETTEKEASIISNVKVGEDVDPIYVSDESVKKNLLLDNQEILDKTNEFYSRLENINSRIGTRIDKLENEGEDVGKISNALAGSRAAVSEGKIYAIAATNIVKKQLESDEKFNLSYAREILRSLSGENQTVRLLVEETISLLSNPQSKVIE
jgi:hypothetical protein